MADNGTESPRRPRVTVGELAMAHATREPIGRSETVGIKAATTGALAGTLWPDVQLNRDPDETLEQWQARMNLALRGFLGLCLVYNDENYRAELKGETLALIRGAS